MISIIIPVYNVEKYLSECLDSILAQTYTDYEVILVDDGSSDCSGAICDEYAKKEARIQVIHQENAGVSVARNNGIKQARGEWITFVDSDDWLDSDFLAAFQLDDDAEMSVTGLRYIRCPERVEMKTWNFEEKSIFLSKDFEDIAKNNLLEYGTVCCKVYKKQVLDEYNIRFDKNISYHEDHLLLLQYLQHIDKVSMHRAVGYNYRITYSGQSLSSKMHPWDKLNHAAEAMFGELKRLPYFDKLSKWYVYKIGTFCLSPKVSACHSVFASDMPKKEKKLAITIIISDACIIRDYYKPVGLRNRILKACLLRGYIPLKTFYCSINFAKRLIKR